MGEAQYRTSFDQRLTFQVVAPATGGPVPLSIYSLLTGAQQAELAGYIVMAMQVSPIASPIFYFHALGNGPTWALSVNSQGVGISSNQKPNEFIYVQNADKKIFIQSQSASPVTVQIAFDCVTKDNL